MSNAHTQAGQDDVIDSLPSRRELPTPATIIRKQKIDAKREKKKWKLNVGNHRGGFEKVCFNFVVFVFVFATLFVLYCISL